MPTEPPNPPLTPAPFATSPPQASNGGPKANAAYRPNFTRGSLLVPESRLVAGLLLDRVSPEGWIQAIAERNLLQKRTWHTAQSYAWLVRRRLETMSPGLWTLVRDAPLPVAASAVFAATVKYSPLLGDFMQQVLSEQYRKFETHLRRPLWDRYIDDCRDRDPAAAAWSDSTLAKLRQNALRMLAEAGYLADTRSLALQRVHAPNEILAYLKDHREDYVLRCIQVSQ